MKKIKIIAACDFNSIIGHGVNMPGWHITDDFKLNFVPKTKGCPVIMGRITAETFKDGPLKNRTNIVISRNPHEVKLPEGFIVVGSMKEAISLAEKAPGDTIWIIGGGQIYKIALDELEVSEIHLSRVAGSFPSKNPGNEIEFPKFFHTGKYVIDRNQYRMYKKREPKDNDKGNSHTFTIQVYVQAN